MMPAGHQPIIPPFSPATRDQVVDLLNKVRRLKIDLEIACSAGLPLQHELNRAQMSIDQLQRLYDTYFAKNPAY